MQKDLSKILYPIAARVRKNAYALWRAKAEGGPFKVDQQLSKALLKAHALGEGKPVGVYFVGAAENVCRAALLDIDDHAGRFEFESVMEIAWELAEALGKRGLICHPWRSGGGFGVHLWLLWDVGAPQDAFSVRKVLEVVMEETGYKVGSSGVSEGEIEIFPKQDEVGAGSYGNQAFLPLGRRSVPLIEKVGGDGYVVGSREDLAEGYEWVMSEPVKLVERPAKNSLLGLSSLASETPQSGLPTSGGIATITEMLSFIKFDRGEDYSYDLWMRVGFAIHHATKGSDEGLALWDAWSALGASYEGFEVLKGKWASIWNDGAAGRGVVTEGTLKRLAGLGGWVEDVSDLFEVTVAEDRMQGDETRLLPPFIRTEKGIVKANTNNLLMALKRPDVCGFDLRYDTFTDEVMVRSAEGVNSGALSWRTFKDSDYTWIKARLENGSCGFAGISREELRADVWTIAELNSFDSAALWLGGLEWDGVERVERFLPGYLAASDTPYARALGRYVWSALAGRVLRPGVKADMVPVLVGPQGAGKSRAIAAIAPAEQFFCEINFGEKDDDLARKMRGVMVCEIAELQGLGTREEETIKAFITRTHEKWTPKYKEYKATFARRSLFFGTTNASQFLADVTGNRRWLPFRVEARGEDGRVARIEVGAIERDRDQLWAEGAVMFRGSGVAYRTVEDLAAAEHSGFTLNHPWEDRVLAWIDSRAAAGLDSDFLCTNELFEFGLNMGGRTTGADGRQLGKVMRALGYENGRGGGKVQTRGWVKNHS